MICCDWNHISSEQCYLAGNILGRIHALDTKEVTGIEAADTDVTESMILWHE